MASCKAALSLLFSVVLISVCATANWTRGLELVMAASKLPVAVDNVRALYDGQDSIYIIGGQGNGGMQENVLRYWLALDTVQVLGTFIGSASGAAAILYEEDLIYLVSSTADAEFQIYHYSTTTHNRTLVSRLPFTLYLKAHVWDPNSKLLYLFGGLNGAWDIDHILRYDPSDNQIEAIGQLPEVLSIPTAVWDEDQDVVYIFDGWTTDILQYHPRQGSVTKLSTSLPSRMVWPCAVMAAADRRAYMFGGEGWMRFDSVSGRAEDIDIHGWGGADINSAACVYVHKLDRVYVIGGRGHYNGTAHDYRDEISYIDLGL